MELSIIFVNWNSTAYLRDCIASIREHTGGIEFEIVVVDNASPIRDVGAIKQEFSQVVLIESPVNLGFAGANNLGFRQSSGEYLLFLNPDTKLIGPAINQLLAAAKAMPRAGIFGCRLLNTDLSVQTSCIQTFPTILNQALDTDFLRRLWPRCRLWGTEPLLSGSASPVRVEAISGACMMMRRSVFAAAGMFSEDYFMYAEDLDLCRQAAGDGFDNYFVGHASIVHHGGKSSTPRTATAAKWRSMLRYFARNRGSLYALVFRAVMSLVALFRLALLTPVFCAGVVAGKEKPAWSAFLKWKTILATLLTRAEGETRPALQARQTSIAVPLPDPSGAAPMHPVNTRYVVITPVRDEEAFLRLTVECMLRQSVRPAEWVIVNDGSTDKTGAVIDEYARQYPWIRACHRTNRGFRKAGGGVVEAFNDGYQALVCTDFDFLVKFDGDLSFRPDYFEKCLAHFEREPDLGIGGGTIYHVVDGREHLEPCPAFHVRGATKIYRKSCWEALGSLWPAPGWDTFDEVKANRLGWTTRSFGELHLTHHRLTGTADGIWAGLVKNGRANYICGYHPLFMLGKCVRRLPLRPRIVGSLALCWGFVSGYCKGIPQVDDRLTIAYLRRQQLGRLSGASTIWK